MQKQLSQILYKCLLGSWFLASWLPALSQKLLLKFSSFQLLPDKPPKIREQISMPIRVQVLCLSLHPHHTSVLSSEPGRGSLPKSFEMMIMMKMMVAMLMVAAVMMSKRKWQLLPLLL